MTNVTEFRRIFHYRKCDNCNKTFRRITPEIDTPESSPRFCDYGCAVLWYLKNAPQYIKAQRISTTQKVG